MSAVDSVGKLSWAVGFVHLTDARVDAVGLVRGGVGAAQLVFGGVELGGDADAPLVAGGLVGAEDRGQGSSGCFGLAGFGGGVGGSLVRLVHEAFEPGGAQMSIGPGRPVLDRL